MEKIKCPYSEAFKKVIDPSVNSRNDGQIALCCYSFFTRYSKHHSENHLGPFQSIRAWANENWIKTDEDLKRYWKDQNLKELPEINERCCKQKILQLENTIEFLNKRVIELESQMNQPTEERAEKKRNKCAHCGNLQKLK